MTVNVVRVVALAVVVAGLVFAVHLALSGLDHITIVSSR